MGVVFGRISEETPKYDVVAEDIGEGVMVRRYAPVYVAKCVSTDFSNIKNRNDFNSAAFRVLAKYIGVFTKPRNTVASEQTESGEKIAMTAPVKLEKIPMTAPVVLTNDSYVFFNYICIHIHIFQLKNISLFIHNKVFVNICIYIMFGSETRIFQLYMYTYPYITTQNITIIYS